MHSYMCSEKKQEGAVTRAEAGAAAVSQGN